MYSSSQKLSEPSQNVRLVIAKFSHATTSTSHSGPLAWSHIFSHGDIVAVFEKSASMINEPARAVLKVYQGRNILEAIDLSHYIREATYSHQLQSSSRGNTKSPFAVIVKLPCLAVKYPVNSQYVRRFQVKFSSVGDYYAALAVLSNIRCPFTEPGGSSTRPTSRTSSVWNYNCAPSGRGFNVPLSANPGMPTLLNGASTSPANTFTENPNSAGPSLLSSGVPYFSSSLTNTAPINASQGYEQIAAEYMLPESSTPEQNSSNTASNTASRPSTAATACHDTQTLNQLLPPRRELPFSKPGLKRAREEKEPPSKDTQTNAAATKPTSSANGTDSSKATKKNDTNPRQRRTTTRKPATTKASSTVPQSNNNNGTTETPDNPRGPNNKQQQQQPEVLRPSNPPMPNGKTNENQPHPSNAPTIPSTSSSNNRNNTSQPQPQPQPQESQPPNNNANNTTTKTITATDLSSYLTTPTSERAALVESWICQQLEDDTFVQLCRDVEGVWRRIALGRM